MNPMNSRRPFAGRRRACLRSAGASVCALALMALSLANVGCGGLAAQAQELEERGDLENAVAVYREILQEDPEDRVALSNAAVCLMVMGEYDEAVVLQERLVALDPTDSYTRVELGFNYLNHQDRPGDAVRVLREATLLEPSAKNLTFLGQALIASGDKGGAEQTLRQAVEVDPEYSHSYGVLVNFLEAEGRMGEAEQVAEQAALQGITIPNGPQED